MTLKVRTMMSVETKERVEKNSQARNEVVNTVSDSGSLRSMEQPGAKEVTPNKVNRTLLSKGSPPARSLNHPLIIQRQNVSPQVNQPGLLKHDASPPDAPEFE